jgi:hypothetical protein
LQLTEVQDAMKDGAKAALAKNLTYQEATRAFQLSLVNEALAENEGVRHRAAQKLRMSPAWVSALVGGTRPTKFRRGDYTLNKRKPENEDAGGSSQEEKG